VAPTPIPPTSICGTWKSATISGTTVTTASDPAKNQCPAVGSTGAGIPDPIPPLQTTNLETGYCSEAIWDIGALQDAGLLQAGHSYRLQYMVHDGDQNKSGGDVGQNCVNVSVPLYTRTPTPIPTAVTQSAAATCVDDAGGVGTVAWTNPGNAQSSDDADATSNEDGNKISHRLKCTGFGFNIPAGATIQGIEVEWERFAQVATNGNQDSAVRIVKGGSIDTTVNRADPNPWSTTEDFYAYGGAADRWGLSWSADDINSPDFGAALSGLFVGGGGKSIASVDSARITVFYNP
jgi:hypothetical protein